MTKPFGMLCAESLAEVNRMSANSYIYLGIVLIFFGLLILCVAETLILLMRK